MEKISLRRLFRLNLQEKLANVMFPHPLKTPEEYEAMYPARNLPEGARVTRVAPSPTGYLHIGTFFSALVDRLLAGEKGVFYFRLEDTDQKREVEGGADNLLSGLNTFGLTIDEGFVAPGEVKGEYGPYKQSERVAIYHTFVKELVKQGNAYPCFCTEDARAEARTRQEAAKARTGYYGEYAVCRNIPTEEAIARIEAGESYVVRLRSPGSEQNRIKFDDLLRGTIEMPENDEDLVLLKSDGIPTYHFAHAIDDHFMRTTHVARGDEWIASLPKHVQLFRMLGFKAPKYLHISPIMKMDGDSKRKISKRKDPEAAMHFYAEQGYSADSVQEYLMTIASSDFEDWRRANPTLPREKFPFNPKKMSVSGALFDMDKMTDVSKGVISRMTAEDVAAAVTAWAAQYDEEFHALLTKDADYTVGIFAIDRGGNKPRKDMAKWNEARDYAAYFFDELFDGAFELPENVTPADAKAILAAYKDVYDETQDKSAWFDTVKSICEPLGFCPEVKEYKKNPDGWKGHAGDVSTVIRLAVTGRRNTPDLCAIMQLLGRRRVMARLDAAMNK